MQMYSPVTAHAHNPMEWAKEQLLKEDKETGYERGWRKDNPEGTIEEYVAWLVSMSEKATPGCSIIPGLPGRRYRGEDDREERNRNKKAIATIGYEGSRRPVGYGKDTADPWQQENDQQSRSSSSWRTDWKSRDNQTSSKSRARSTGDIGSPWTKRSRGQGWSYAENDEEYWHDPDDKEWYDKNHSWKRRYGRQRASYDDFKMPP